MKRQETHSILEVDLNLFAKNRNALNEGAKIVRTEDGAYLAMAYDMSIRRYCHMHKFDYAKKCERPACDRYLFPQLHPEAEMIGKAVFYPGTNTMEMCSKMVKRVDNSLYLCKLCIFAQPEQVSSKKNVKTTIMKMLLTNMPRKRLQTMLLV